MKLNIIIAFLFVFVCGLIIILAEQNKVEQEQKELAEKSYIEQRIGLIMDGFKVISTIQHDIAIIQSECVTREETEDAIIKYCDSSITVNQKIAEAMKQVRHYESEAFCIITPVDDEHYDLACTKK